MNATPSELEEISALIPEFEFLEVRGHGGMGVVYKARQRSLDRLVAIKVLDPRFGPSDDAAARFMREARTLASLNHPNIVAVHDFGEVEGKWYIVMEYVEGVDLSARIRDGDLTFEEVLHIIPQVCDALQFAHGRGVVHRDIKPSNILIGESGRVKVADFGLARMLDPGFVTLTATHESVGTPLYASPEQREDPEMVDHRSDIYALGAIFYEMLMSLGDDSGDGGMTWQVLDSAGRKLSGGLSSKGDPWRWMTFPASPETDYTLVVADKDTAVTGGDPANDAWAGITLSLYAANLTVAHVREVGPPDRMIEKLAAAQGRSSGDWVDVLPLVDVARDAILGQWVMEDGSLKQLEPGWPMKELVLPVGVGDSYEVEMEFTKLAGQQSVNIRFPVRRVHPFLVISGYPQGGYYSQVAEIIDESRGEKQNPSRAKGPPLENGRRYRCNLRVVVDGDDVQIASELDGQQLVQWTGPIRSVSGAGMYGGYFLFYRTLALAVPDGAAQFHRIRVRSLEGVSEPAASQPERDL